ADEGEVLAVGGKRNGAVNLRRHLARRAAEQWDLVELIREFAFWARDVIDEAVVRRKRHAFEDDFGRRDDLRAVVDRRLLDPQALQIAVFQNISDVLSVTRDGRE